MKTEIKSAYLASEGFEQPLLAELHGALSVQDRLILSDREAQPARWAQNVWRNPKVIGITSISDAAKKLTAMQRNWCLYSCRLHRRARLIEEKLPHVSGKALAFPAPLPASPLGSWTLLDADTLLAASDCSSLFPNGELRFEEDKAGPPNRAYLKLWEAWTLLERRPQPGAFCIDAGASPGGWTWAAAKLGARVLSVDRAPLDASLSGLDNVEFRKGDAFSLHPAEFSSANQKVDWLLSDVVCYPEKLWQWLSVWIESGVCRNIVCTVKFQGGAQYDAVESFAQVPRSRIAHLFHNKHELTFMLAEESVTRPG